MQEVSLHHASDMWASLLCSGCLHSLALCQKQLRVQWSDEGWATSGDFVRIIIYHLHLLGLLVVILLLSGFFTSWWGCGHYPLDAFSQPWLACICFCFYFDSWPRCWMNISWSAITLNPLTDEVDNIDWLITMAPKGVGYIATQYITDCWKLGSVAADW